MGKYLRVFRMNLKNTKMFQLDFYLGALAIPITLAVSYLFWQRVLYGNSQIDLSSLIGYFLFLQILQMGFQSAMYVTYELWNEINNGTIIVWMNRPIYYPLYIFAQKAALFCIQMSSAVVVSIVVSLIVGYKLPPLNVLLGCVSSILGYLILFELQFIIGCLTFWLKKVIVLRDVIMSCLFLLGGIMLPIDLTPALLQKLAYLTPIPFVYFVPAKIFGGEFTLTKTGSQILLQFFWALLFQGIVFLMWRQGTRDKIAQGA